MTIGSERMPSLAARPGQETTRATDAPHVVVVVLNWCGESDTVACLRSLAASDWPRLTVLLVDNGSPDGSGERLHAAFPDVPYLQTGANLGYAGGNNRGFDWALAQGADHVVVLNNDTVVDPSCIRRLVEVAEADASVGLVVPKMLVHDAPDRIWYGGGTLSLVRGTGRHLHEGAPDASAGNVAGDVTFASGCCFLVPRRVLEAVGGFEESFFAYNEDVDLSYRLSRAGWRLRYEPRARLLHRVPTHGEPPSPFQIRLRDRNRRRFAALRLGAMRRLAFAGFFYPSRAVLALRYALRGDRARVRAILEGAFG